MFRYEKCSKWNRMFQYVDHLIAWRFCCTLNRRIKFDMKFNQPSDPATITRSFASKMRCWFLFILFSFIKLPWLKWHKPRTHSADIAQLCLCYLFANGQTGIKQWSISHLRGRLYFMLDFSEWFIFFFFVLFCFHHHSPLHRNKKPMLAMAKLVRQNDIYGVCDSLCMAKKRYDMTVWLIYYK